MHSLEVSKENSETAVLLVANQVRVRAADQRQKLHSAVQRIAAWSLAVVLPEMLLLEAVLLVVQALPLPRLLGLGLPRPPEQPEQPEQLPELAQPPELPV